MYIIIETLFGVNIIPNIVMITTSLSDSKIQQKALFKLSGSGVSKIFDIDLFIYSFKSHSQRMPSTTACIEFLQSHCGQ